VGYNLSVARFTYTAQKADGEVYNGIAEAQDRFELYNVIRKEGAHLLSFHLDNSDNRLSFAYWIGKVTSVPMQQKILFMRNLGVMLSAGLPLSRALAVMERQTKDMHLLKAISEISSDIRHGITLHESIAKFPTIFPRLAVAMVRAGEEGGDLASALVVASEQMEHAADLKKKIRGAMIYPAIILVTIVIIAVLMMLYVVPTLSQTFAELGSALPLPTQIVLNFSNFLVNYTVFAIGGMIAAVFLIGWLLRTKVGGRFKDYALLRFPLIKEMVKEINAARTSRTLASLLSSGVGILPALDIARDVVQNSYFKEVITEAQKAVGAGDPLSKTFTRREDLYPAFVGEMMSVGEETGQTSEMLKRLAAYYENEVDRKTKDMSTIIEPILMLMIGAMVGFFAVSMIMPIYSISSHI
jgi:type IV pilus assembly protein PilC